MTFLSILYPSCHRYLALFYTEQHKWNCLSGASFYNLLAYSDAIKYFIHFKPHFLLSYFFKKSHKKVNFTLIKLNICIPTSNYIKRPPCWWNESKLVGNMNTNSHGWWPNNIEFLTLIFSPSWRLLSSSSTRAHYVSKFNAKHTHRNLIAGWAWKKNYKLLLLNHVLCHAI